MHFTNNTSYTIVLGKELFLSLSPLSRVSCSFFSFRSFEREIMAVSRVFLGVALIFALMFAIVSPPVQAQSIAPAPAPASDGTSIDQGIAYVLMLAALVLTYLIHPLDASSYTFF